MSEDTSSAQDIISEEQSLEDRNIQEFKLKTQIQPVQHNTNIPQLSAICTTYKACKNARLLSLLAIFIGIIVLFIHWKVGLGIVGVSLGLQVLLTIQSIKLGPKLLNYYRNGFVLSELKKYIQIEQFSDSVEPLKTPVDPAAQNSENPAENPAIITSNPWTHGRINQKFEGIFNDRRFRFFSAELVNAPAQDELIAFRTGTHVWNGQFYQFDVEKPFETEIDIFSIPNADGSTPYIIRKCVNAASDNDDYVQNGGDPYAIDVLTLQRTHAWSSAAIRIYSAKKLAQKMSDIRPNQASHKPSNTEQTGQEGVLSLSECGYDTPSFRQMLSDLNSVLKNRCYTIRIRHKMLSIVIEGIEDPFTFPGMDADRTAIAACCKLEIDIKQFVSILEIICNSNLPG